MNTYKYLQYVLVPICSNTCFNYIQNMYMENTDVIHIYIWISIENSECADTMDNSRCAIHIMVSGPVLHCCFAANSICCYKHKDPSFATQLKHPPTHVHFAAFSLHLRIRAGVLASVASATATVSQCWSYCTLCLQLCRFPKKCCILAKIPQEVLAACSSYYPRINRGNVNIVFEDLVSKDSWFKRFSSPRWNILLC